MENYYSIIKGQRQFFESNKTKDIHFRKFQLQKLLSVLQTNEKMLCEALWTDLHKPEFETYATELGIIYSEIRLAIKKLHRWSKPKSVSTNLPNLPGKSFIMTEPFGNSLIIGAWNYPYYLTLGPLIGAMAAGNTIILKPSELTPACSATLAKIINKDFDPQYFQVIEGGIPETSELLRQKFDYIFFTGSARIGKIIYKAAAENLTPVTLELGGKSPCIVDKDAALKVAAKRIAWGKFINAGQTCIAPDYLLVHETIKDELLGYIKNFIIGFYGENPQLSPDFLRVVNRPNFERLASLIDPEKVYFGGKTDADNLYISPTILENVEWSDPVMEDEIFGPILPVLTFSDIGEAIRSVAKYPNPLALYYFSKDKKKQRQVLSEIGFGGGTINDTIMHISNGNLPFGGVGNSGFGNYHGKAGFETFSHHKSVMKRPTWIDLPLKYPPYNNTKLNLVKKVL
jgi:aldehyde dehydrogenase (NAD+)